jgi:hypothetical protein
MNEKRKCDKCGKETLLTSGSLMQEGVGIKFSKNSRVIESKVRNWVEDYSGKKITWFPWLCYVCQNNEYLRRIMQGKE